MKNCYVHPDRLGADICVLCGRSICRECSKRVAESVYCPTCWESSNPTAAERKAGKTTVPPIRAGIPARLYRAVYYATGVLVFVVFWYVYGIFIEPIIAPFGEALPLPPLGIGEIWNNNGMMISFSALMFIIVLVAGELLLRPGHPKGRVESAGENLQASVS